MYNYENIDEFNLTTLELLKILTFDNFEKVRKPRQLENYKQLNNLNYKTDRFKIKHKAIFKSENYNKDFFEKYFYFNNDNLTVYYNENETCYYYSIHSTIPVRK